MWRHGEGAALMILLMIAIGAGVGAPARYLTDRTIQSWHDTGFPWGTLTVNIVASLIFGIMTGAGTYVSTDLVLLISTGFCGALSTFSTFSYETLRLVQDGARFHAVANIAISLVAGIGAAALGWSIGLSLS